MRKNSVKNTRLNGEVMKVLSGIIRDEIKDPRISPWTSIVACEVAPDLKTCKVWISVLGSDEDARNTGEGLKSAAPFIRRELAHTMNLRNTPEITFLMDTSIAHGVDMIHKIDEVIARDDEARKARGEEDEDAVEDPDASDDEED